MFFDLEKLKNILNTLKSYNIPVVNLDFFNKNNIQKFLYNQFIPLNILFILGTVLTYKNHSPIYIIFILWILIYSSYFLHKFTHYIPTKINPHYNIHHKHDLSSVFKIIIYLIEICMEFMIPAFILYKTQKYYKYELISHKLILYYSLIYTSIHIINYSFLNIGNHHDHHDADFNNKKSCNFGPDTIDHLLGTNCNSKYENINHIIPNIILSFLFVYYIS